MRKTSNEENLAISMQRGGIEQMEADGQKEFVCEEVLPKQCPREELEKLGFVFGEDDDDIFIKVKFPDGWKKVAKDHSMWSDLVDDKDRKRGSIFYKAAFYDRSSYMRLSCRYTVEKNYSMEKDGVQYQGKDCGNAIYETAIVEVKEYCDEYWVADKKLDKEATEWILKNFPDHESPVAYWD